jgi:hypothetical protein
MNHQPCVHGEHEPGARPAYAGCSEIHGGRHIGAFFSDAQSEDHVLLPILKRAFEDGWRTEHLVSPGQGPDHVRRLESAGIDAAAAGRRGQFTLREWDEMLFPGCFDVDRMLTRIMDSLRSARGEGYARTCFLARMTWAAAQAGEGRELIEYEARLNLIANPASEVICTYDPARLDKAALQGVLRTHPVFIFRGRPQPNPFYVPPEEILGAAAGREGMILPAGV